MMNDELGSATRALLDAAREGITPQPAAIARVRANVGAAIGAGAAGALVAKLGAIAIVAAIAIGGAVYFAADEPDRVAPVVPPREHPVTAPVVATTNQPAIEPAPAPREELMMPPIVASHAAPTPSHARPVVRADLAREVELIDDAMAALRRGDATAALAAVRRHASETVGSGQLAEDAAAIEIEALCRLGGAPGGIDAKRAAFDARWPGSAQRARLEKECL